MNNYQISVFSLFFALLNSFPLLSQTVKITPKLVLSVKAKDYFYQNFVVAGELVILVDDRVRIFKGKKETSFLLPPKYRKSLDFKLSKNKDILLIRNESSELRNEDGLGVRAKSEIGCFTLKGNLLKEIDLQASKRDFFLIGDSLYSTNIDIDSDKTPILSSVSLTNSNIIIRQTLESLRFIYDCTWLSPDQVGGVENNKREKVWLCENKIITFDLFTRSSGITDTIHNVENLNSFYLLYSKDNKHVIMYASEPYALSIYYYSKLHNLYKKFKVENIFNNIYLIAGGDSVELEYWINGVVAYYNEEDNNVYILINKERGRVEIYKFLIQ